MKLENQLSGLKLKLKKWELSFSNENGRKPTQQDISDNAKVKSMYAKYFKVRKDLSLSSNNENRTSVSTNSKKIWGENLLKSKAKTADVDSPSENLHADQHDTTFSTETYREKLKQNLSSSCTKMLPTKLKSSQTNKLSGISSQEKPVADTTNIACEFSVNDKSDSSVESSGAINLNENSLNKGVKTSTNASCFNYVSKTAFNSNHKIRKSFLNKKINPKWFNQEDGLPNLKNSSKVAHPGTYEVTKASEATLPSQKITDSQNNAVNFVADKKSSNSEDESPIVKTAIDLTTNVKSDPCTPFNEQKVIQWDSCPRNTTSTIFKSVTVTTNMESSLSQKSSACDSRRENLPTEQTSDCVPVDIDVKSACDEPYKVDNSAMDEPVAKSQSTGLTTRSRSVVSTNYVRINIQKKVYLRKAGRGKFLRRKVALAKLAKKGFIPRNKWRSGRSTGASNFKGRSDNTCFKCGQPGHWANKCTQTSKSGGHAKDFVLSDEKDATSETLEEILNHHQLHFNDEPGGSIQMGSNTVPACKPLYDDDTYDENEVLSVLKQFGFSTFRPGQNEAIKRILCGKPTLLVLSTGMGKSLCYQLPAYMYSMKRNSITLVVSPLVSLMDDQITGLPKFIKAVCLHSGMTKEQRDKILTEIEEKKVDILLVSPEAITAWAGMSPYSSPFSKLPPIAFVCIDECHCLSEWSHNFRPSYLRVCQVLREHLGVKCLVGLTATSTLTTCDSIARQLGIDDCSNGIIKETSLPENLRLSISRDQYRDEALQELLINEPFRSLQSIIIYCTRRDEAGRLASFLRTTLQYQENNTASVNQSEPVAEEVVVSNCKSKKRKRTAQSKGGKRKALTWDVDCYHAGKTAAERRRVQKRFMSGQLRVVVATVAFGMGIDKHDVRAVVHYNMPRSFERYVQEIGRAGRDGQAAYCHTFLNSQGADLSELSRHIYAKTIDRYVVKLLVKKVFKSCSCSELGNTCTGHLRSIPIDESIELLDLNREGIETLICYMELDGLIKVFLPTQATCLIRCYDGPKQMAAVAKKCPAVALGLASQGETFTLTNELRFSVIEVADRLGMSVANLKRNLRALMWDTTLSDNPTSGRSGVTVEFERTSFLLKTLRESSDDFLDHVTDSLHKRVVCQERKELAQLQTCFDTLQKYSVHNVASGKDDVIESKSKSLKTVINQYFVNVEDDMLDCNQDAQLESSIETELRLSVRQFLNVHNRKMESLLDTPVANHETVPSDSEEAVGRHPALG